MKKVTDVYFDTIKIDWNLYNMYIVSSELIVFFFIFLFPQIVHQR
jgi:hypothetical protein